MGHRKRKKKLLRKIKRLAANIFTGAIAGIIASLITHWFLGK